MAVMNYFNSILYSLTFFGNICQIIGFSGLYPGWGVRRWAG
jgi:hypothetical protein